MIELLQKEGFSFLAESWDETGLPKDEKLSGRRQAELALEEVGWSSPKARRGLEGSPKQA